MSQMLDLPEIATSRLRLRRLRLEDGGDLQRLTDDPAILGAIHFLPRPFTLANAEALIRGLGDGRDCFLGGRLASCGILAVVCGAHLQGEDAVEIGYWVGTDFVGARLAFEAMQAILLALRSCAPHRQLFAECRRGNEASWHLLHKLGFSPTGAPGKRPGRMRLVSLV